MKILNISSNKFKVGRSITCIKDYTNGSVRISVGDKGIIEKITIESFPDLSLFNIRILHMIFGTQELGMGEGVAIDYFKAI